MCEKACKVQNLVKNIFLDPSTLEVGPINSSMSVRPSVMLFGVFLKNRSRNLSEIWHEVIESLLEKCDEAQFFEKNLVLLKRLEKYQSLVKMWFVSVRGFYKKLVNKSFWSLVWSYRIIVGKMWRSPIFWEKSGSLKKVGKVPQFGENVVFHISSKTSHWITLNFSEFIQQNVFHLLKKIAYLGKFWFLGYFKNRSQPIRLHHFSILDITWTT